ncbi:DUF4097 family beta strand repeat-containing protein [Planobispora takensis]|uniref:DUF4097 domain-containing protein n=1 Tax=Planobispora takensis TaxID=1367882 RepID=A0A8J3T036_9ACTN|nr:DUF4097 family beta strand repeat-containing protein [Planobispora takensis]GII01530.1 hypothetical protein Pta02_35380 [Planobispora takensis]
MPTFPTPGPITFSAHFAGGSLRITASDREDTTVDIRPADPSDLDHARSVRVEHDAGTVSVKAPDLRSLRRIPAVDVVVALPSGSHVRADTVSADVSAAGPLCDVEISTASGDVTLEHAAGLRVRTTSGDVRCDVTEGPASVKTTSGAVRLGAVAGPAGLTTVSGEAEIGEAGGDVTAKSASGRIRVHRIAGGQVSVNTASGDVSVGVASGTATWLDVSSLSGKINSELTPFGQDDQPTEDENTVELGIRTVSGDISITRSEGTR